MPTLSDTELRVLLVVLRQTVGWRKERDWLARSQLVVRTGRSAHAVSRAVDDLVRRGLVVVEDVEGYALATTEARRAARSALYYRAGRRLLAPPDSYPRGVLSASTGDRDNKPVVAQKNTPPPSHFQQDTSGADTQWLQEAPLDSTEQERIEIEKERIRQRLRKCSLTRS